MANVPLTRDTPSNPTRSLLIGPLEFPSSRNCRFWSPNPFYHLLPYYCHIFIASNEGPKWGFLGHLHLEDCLIPQRRVEISGRISGAWCVPDLRCKRNSGDHAAHPNPRAHAALRSETKLWWVQSKWLRAGSVNGRPPKSSKCIDHHYLYKKKWKTCPWGGTSHLQTPTETEMNHGRFP